MSQYKSSIKCKFSYIIILIIIIVILLLMYIQYQINIHMSEVCEYKGKEIVNDIITHIVKENIDNSAVYYNIEKDSNDKILSLETNAESVNILQNNLRFEINKALKEIENEKLSIAIGSLTDIYFLNGRGFNVNLRLNQIGYVDTEIISKFESAGINQTRQYLSLIVKVEFEALIAFDSKKVSVEEEYLLSDNYIIGNVPNTYVDKK